MPLGSPTEKGKRETYSLFVAHGHQTYEFAGLGKLVFEIDGAVGVDLGRNVQDGDVVQVLLFFRSGLAVAGAGVADDAHFGGQGTQGFFDVVQRHHGAPDSRDVFAEFLLLGGFRLVAGKVHGVGAYREFAYVIGQGESAVGLHLRCMGCSMDRQQAYEGRLEEL